MKALVTVTLLLLLVGLKAETVDRDSIDRRKLALAVSAEAGFYAAGLSYLSFIWYKDAERVPFHLYNDAAGYLQMDKFGHAYGAYIESKTCYELMRYAGLSERQSIWWGGTMGLIMQTPIEIFDGIYEGWGFSWPDMAANAAGSALFIGQQLAWEEQKLNFKFSFQRSSYAPGSHGMLGDNVLESLFLDYNGQSYWISTGIHEFIGNEQMPRWIDVSFGYSANGMYGEFENKLTWGGKPLPMATRHRQFLVSFDIDWEEIPTDKIWLKHLFTALNYIKLPFPAVEWNQETGWRAHALYF